MVQKEIKHKTKLYTIVAIFSVIILVSAIYTVTTPTVMYGTLGIPLMKNFTSNDELRDYLLTNTGYSMYSPSVPKDDIGTPENTPVPTASGIVAGNPSTGAGSYSASIGYQESSTQYWARPTDSSQDPFSTTNIQVVGVDEADIVKTDGQYIYVLSRHGALGTTIQIVKANSQNSAVVGKIAFEGSTYIDSMYLSESGDKLALIGLLINSSSIFYSSSGVPYRYNGGDVQTVLYVYDVSSKAEPVLARSLILNGNYFSSRVIGNYVYVVVNQPAYVVDNETVVLPQVCVDTITTEIASTSIYYTDVQDTSFLYSTFIGLNLIDATEQPTYLTLLTGASSCMYVSTNNMYVTFGKSGGTEIYRISFNRLDMTFRAQGVVPGDVLNQYSMDEYNKYFRIATTVSPWVRGDIENEHNNLYVLNMNLDMVGKLENLAQGERIYSARFAGDKAYLVTFKQIDPFFVLDLKNPSSPKVVGELKIPGFSSYLHPYNENYIIGIGKEDAKVKLSLFDVTDMNNPTEIAKYIIGEEALYSQSIVLNEPKAFLFDQQKQLLVMPVVIGAWPSNLGRPDSSVPISNGLWSGVYVFKVSPENGFILQGELSHPATNNNGWSDYAEITRSLYIGNTLYTISNDMIQLHHLDNLVLIAKITF